MRERLIKNINLLKMISYIDHRKPNKIVRLVIVGIGGQSDSSFIKSNRQDSGRREYKFLGVKNNPS